MRWRNILAIGLVLLSISTVRAVVEVVELEGFLEVKKEGQESWQVFKNSILDESHTIRTLDGTRVTLLVKDGKGGRFFVIGANSLLKVSEIVKNPPLSGEEFLVLKCLSNLHPVREEGVSQNPSFFGGERGRDRPILIPPIEREEPSIDILEFNGGRDLFKNGLYENAIRRYLMFMGKYKGSLLLDDAQFWVAEALMCLKKYSAALNEYKSLLSTYPKSLWVERAKQRISQIESN
jgi:tetratricopeptide (TPR) repeat protein